MTPISAAEAAAHPLTTDDDVLQRVRDLIGRAESRALWLLFLDEQSVQLPLMVPFDDYPELPGEYASRFAELIAQVIEQSGGGSAIAVWERVAPAPADAQDRAWASALAIACARADVALRAQLIAHRDGVRWFAPDDYL